MERVKKEERYWYIITDDEDGGIHISIDFDDYSDLHDVRNRIGNYFHTKEEAESMAKKLRAVLNGADVIKMPSEEEFYKVAPSTDKLGGYSLENRRQVRGFQDCWDWIKSKIVK